MAGLDAGVAESTGTAPASATPASTSARCAATPPCSPSARTPSTTCSPAARRRPARDVTSFDVVAALCTPPDLGWFVGAAHGQGRTDLDQPTRLARRDAFLRTALHRLAG